MQKSPKPRRSPPLAPPDAPPEAPGLRERKKQQTRLAISDVATRLFIERGFDEVTVAEVAAAAGVSVNTIFNYFGTKEELFFDRGPQSVGAAARIVRDRRPGESAVEALRRATREAIGGGTGRGGPTGLRVFVATVQASPALRAHARLLLVQSERALAETLAAESGAPAGDPTAPVLAALITGLVWLLIEEFQTRVLRDEPASRYRPALLRLADRGFDLLEAGAPGYCARPA